MVGVVDLIATIGGLVIPPAFDFLKKKFVKEENDTPERTMGALATTKPEVLPEYAKGLAELFKAQCDYFNRDVVGEVHPWVRDLRASIRPMCVVASLAVLTGMTAAILWGGYAPADDLTNSILTGVRVSCEGIITSWMGSRITLKG